MTQLSFNLHQTGLKIVEGGALMVPGRSLGFERDGGRVITGAPGPGSGVAAMGGEQNVRTAL